LNRGYYITPQGEVVMWIAVLFLLWLLYLYLGWPSRVTHHIKKKQGGGESQGAKFMLIPLLSFATIYVAWIFLTSKGSLNWSDPQPVFNAVAITAAIFFTAMRFFPPTFYAAFLPVNDWETGAYSEDRMETISIEKGRLWPLFFVIHNTGITSWDNYRITLDFGEGFEATWGTDDFPSSKDWAWRTKNLRVMSNPCIVALQATNALVVGEPQTIRFLIKAKKTGQFNVGVSVVVSGRPGESKKSLKLNVK